jgi:hypothetical protein
MVRAGNSHVHSVLTLLEVGKGRHMEKSAVDPDDLRPETFCMEGWHLPLDHQVSGCKNLTKLGSSLLIFCNGNNSNFSYELHIVNTFLDCRQL